MLTLVPPFSLPQGWIQALSQDYPSAPFPLSSSPSSSSSSSASRPSSLPLPRPSSLTRRALLRDVMRLALFFGQETTLDHLVPLLSTFFNDKVHALPPSLPSSLPTRRFTLLPPLPPSLPPSLARWTGSCGLRFVTIFRLCVPSSDPGLLRR